MTAKKTYYEILHVQQNTPVEVIKASYRTLMQVCKVHPDLGGCKDQAALINEAYSVLRCPQRRSEYDAKLAELAKKEQLRNHEEEKLRRYEAKKSQQEQQTEPHNPQQQQTTANNAHTARSNFAMMMCRNCNTPHGITPLLQMDARCHKCFHPLFGGNAAPQQPQSRASQVRKNPYASERKTQRIPAGGTMYYYFEATGNRYQGQLLDLSPKGISFACREVIANEKLLYVNSEGFNSVAKVCNFR